MKHPSYSVSMDDSFLRNSLHENLRGQYTIVKSLYERKQKGTYIVDSNTCNQRYFIKYKLFVGKKGDTDIETSILRLLQDNPSEHIVNVHHFIETDAFFIGIYECINGCDLQEYYLQHLLTNRHILLLISDICKGVDHLHKLGIIHCDIKLENILVAANGRAKVSDYDLSKLCDNKGEYLTTELFGTVQYVAPEICNVKLYSKKSDIWAIGIVLYILISHKFPHDMEPSIMNPNNNASRRDIFKHIDFDPIIKKTRGALYGDLLLELIQNMLHYRENMRPSASAISKKIDKWISCD